MSGSRGIDQKVHHDKQNAADSPVIEKTIPDDPKNTKWRNRQRLQEINGSGNKARIPTTNEVAEAKR